MSGGHFYLVEFKSFKVKACDCTTIIYYCCIAPEPPRCVMVLYSHTHDLACGGLHQTRLMVFKGQLLPPSHYTFRRLTLSSARLFGDVGGMEEGEEMGVGMGEGEGEGV